MSANQKADQGCKVQTNVEADSGSELSGIADLLVSDEQADATKGGGDGVRDLLVFNANGATTNAKDDEPKPRGITIVAH